MREREDIITKIIGIFFIVMMVLLALAMIGIEIYIWVTYANTPVEELPSWVLFFMFGGKR